MKPMDKKDWEDIVKEPMSESLKARTMARARQELDEMREQQSRLHWAWLVPILPALGALVLFVRQRQEDQTKNSVLLVSDDEYLDAWTQLSDDELAGLDHEMLRDLDLLEDLDVLEEWDGTTTES